MFGKKTIVGLALAVGLLVNSIASADFSSPAEVSVVWQYSNNDGYVYLEGASCPYGSQGYYVIKSEATHHKTVMSIFTAAHLAGKKVKVGYSNNSGYCIVSSVQLVH